MTWQLTLQLISTRQQIVIPLQDKAILGRSSEVEKEGTFYIDLSPFLAYQLGVSRRHAMLVTENSQILVFDLSSSNGSFLNGKKLSHTDGHVIQDGDELVLGSLKMRIFLKEETATAERQTRPLRAVAPVLSEAPRRLDLPAPDIRSTLTTDAVLPASSRIKTA